MKITLNKSSNGSSIVNKAHFQERATGILNTVVKSHLKVAKAKKELNLNSSQKAHTNCDSHI